MADYSVKEITAEETRPLRHEILRPHQPYEKCIYPRDDADSSLHVGAFEDDRMVGIVSTMNEPPPGEDDPRAWRLRGMAVREDARRRGHGVRLVRRLEDHVASHNGSFIWFNARTSAVPFYRSLGYEPEGEEYEMDELGPHYFMRKYLADTESTAA